MVTGMIDTPIDFGNLKHQNWFIYIMPIETESEKLSELLCITKGQNKILVLP